jgi:hypothetical protein
MALYFYMCINMFLLSNAQAGAVQYSAGAVADGEEQSLAGV